MFFFRPLVSINCHVRILFRIEFFLVLTNYVNTKSIVARLSDLLENFCHQFMIRITTKIQMNRKTFNPGHVENFHDVFTIWFFKCKPMSTE